MTKDDPMAPEQATETLPTLERCRPLRDPVRIHLLLTKFIYLLFAVLFLAYASGVIFHALFYSDEVTTENTILLVAIFFAIPFAYMSTMGLLKLMRLAPQRAVLVRAFRNDMESVRLQRLLAAGLGDTFRLSGIRSPVVRHPFWVRRLFWSFSALAYIGSVYQQLEAEDHDWLARLIKTLTKTDVAIIDLRDATHHVLTEATTCLIALGASRTVFLIDSDPNAKDHVAEVCSNAGHQNVSILMVPADDTQEDQFILDISHAADSIRDKPGDGIDSAIKYALQHVSPAGFNTKFLDTDLSYILCALVFGGLLLNALGVLGNIVLGGRSGTNLILGFIFAAAYIILIVVWLRLRRASDIRLPSAQAYRRIVRKRLKQSAWMTLVPIGTCILLFTLLLPALGAAKRTAERILQSTKLRAAHQEIVLDYARKDQYHYELIDSMPADAGFYELPTNLQTVLVGSYIDPMESPLYDVWGQPILLERAESGELYLISKGRDGIGGTLDDTMLDMNDGYAVRRSDLD